MTLRLFFLLFILSLVSGCGTLYRIIEEPYYNAEKGQSFYNPYNPYYQAVRGDGQMLLPACVFTIVGCPLVIMDLPISFVSDTLMLPYDLARGVYVRHYNKQHITYENYGPFIFKYSQIYKTGNFLDIYYLTLDNSLTSNDLMESDNKLAILAFQSKLLDKRLTPTPRLLVEDRFGAIFIIYVDNVGKVNIRRVGDYSETAVLTNDPDTRVFYRKMADNYFSVRCSMFNCFEGLDEASPQYYTFDVVINANDLSILSDQLTVKYPELSCESEQVINQASVQQCIIQYYLLSLSPNKQQAVYLSSTGKLWVLEQEGSFNFITTLTQHQQHALDKLLEENKQKEQRYYELRDEERQNSYKKESLILYQNYVAWFNTYFKWQQLKTGSWQLVDIKQGL